ncbi:RNA polymerase II-associated protein 1-like isoform X1 [Rhopilema esculentum]|uniref:RNA polymerase II-associated protein 1-like isoform X1 n=2 Tax=Rhopilema esculentum TaxID=499914 RepID=UPI0031D0B31A
MQRPKRKEDEEDLIRFQNQFLQQGIEPSAKVQRVARDASATISKSSDKTRDIVSLHENDEHQHEDKFSKKSRFKTRMEKSSEVKHSLHCLGSSKNTLSAFELLEEKDNHITTMLSRIKERHVIKPSIMKQKQFEGGFPSVPHLGKDIVTNEPKANKKQSLFARQFLSENSAAFGLEQERNVSFGGESETASIVDNSKSKYDNNASHQHSVSGDARLKNIGIVSGKDLDSRPNADKERDEIHKENTRKLAEMTEGEILEAKAKLEATIDPKLLAFLKKKKTSEGKKEKLHMNEISVDDSEEQEVIIENVENEVSNQKVPKNNSSDFDPHKEFDIDKHIPNMNVIEDEKLQWIKNAPKIVQQEGGTATVARFDLEGRLILKDADLPSNLGLHHHGEDPELPGYSLEELFHLARSNFLQQRVFALKLLAAVLEQYYRGSFDGKIQECLLEQLLDAGLPFLLRWALDDATDAVNCAAIYAFSALLDSPNDTVVLDELMYADEGFQVTCLKPLSGNEEIKILKKEKGRDLTDPEVMGIDLIKGLLKIQLLPRLRYILEVCEPDGTTINYCMTILSRVALHSSESCYEILKCPRLMQTIFNKLLPITWSNTIGARENIPFYKALRLIRIMCLAGKSISSKLWNDFDLPARILRYTSSVNEDNDGLSSLIQLATESLHIWRVCLLYGVSSSTTIDVYPYLISLLQKYVLNNDGKYLNLRSSLVLLAAAVVQMTTYKSAEEGLNTRSAQKVRFDCDVEELVPDLDWSMVSGIDSIMWQSIRSTAEAFSSTELELQTDDLRYMACTLLYLAAYTESASQQKSVDKIRFLSEIERWMGEFLGDIIKSSKLSKLMGVLSKFSDFTKPLDTLSSSHEVRSFPNHGMAKLRGMCSSIEPPVIFLSAFTKLLHRIAVVNKGCCRQMLPFLKEQGLIRYLKEICSPKSSTYQLSSSAISSFVERKFLYNLLSLFQVTINCVDSTLMDPGLVTLYHQSAFKLLGILHHNESGEAVDLMMEIIFRRSMYRDSQVEKVAKMLGHLDLSSHSTEQNEDVKSLDSLLNTAKDNLSVTCSVYVAHCFKNGRKAMEKLRSGTGTLHKDSFLLPENQGPLLPMDWVFLPILNLYNMAVSMELRGKIINQLTTDAIKTLEMSLSLILLFEVYMPEALEDIDQSFKLVRILCIFMIGNDAFLEPPVHHLLAALARIYTKPENLDKLCFEKRFPGISSFYDLFTSLLVQFSGTSFGDPLFSNFLLIPLPQRFDVKYRKSLWGENCETLRIFSLPIKSVTIPLSNFLDPLEEEEGMIQLYLKSIASGLIRPSWCPFFYLLAIHHLSSYIFSESESGNADFSNLKIEKKRLLLLDKIVNIKNEEAKLDVLLYEKVDLDSSKGFKVHAKLPANRQVIIENRKRGF